MFPNRTSGKSVPFQPSAGVPLVIAGPGVRAGVETDTLVEIQDLAATYLEVAGAEGLPGSDAKSLIPVLSGTGGVHRDIAVSALGDWRFVWDGQYKLIEEEGAEDRLFDLESDPGEVTNLVGENQAEVRRLREVLEEERR